MAKIVRKSLKIKLFVIFLGVSLVLVSILCAIAYFISSQSLRQGIVSDYQNINSIAETAVLHLLEGAQGKFVLLEESRFLSESLEKVLAKDPNSQQLLRELDRTLDGFRITNPEAKELFILDLSGQVIVSSLDSHVGIDESAMEYFVRGKSSVNIMDVYYSERTKIIGFVMSGPIYAIKSKEKLGVLASRYNMSGIEQIVCDYTGMADTAETFIVNKDSLMLTNSRFVKDAVLKQKVDSEPVKLWHSQKKIMKGVYTGYDGTTVLGCSGGEKLARTYGDLNWVLITNVSKQEAFAPARRLGLIMALIGLSISIVAALVVYLIAKSISDPIALIAQIAEKVGEGDLTVDIAETKSEDEIGILSRSFKQMVISLKTILFRISEVAERLSASGQEVASSAQEMNATTEEVASTVQQISKGTETQAKRVEETRKVLEALAASVLEVAKSARDTATQAAKASETARKGGEAAREAPGKMIKIAEAVMDSVETVKKLGNRSDQMGDIVKIIVNIADQTNLLALNAAIEAARAGEYGRGFAVVAEEVRKLAEGSAKAADQIGELIKDVQKETTQAVASIEDASKEADLVGDIAQKVAQGLIEIIKSAEVMVGAAEQVSATSQLQLAGTEQASKSVAGIAVLAEETASASEEAAASAEEMTASMKEMAASAQDLADMGLTLKVIVTEFKLDEEFSRAESGVQRVAEKETLRPAKLREQVEAMKKQMAELKNKHRDTDGKAKLSRQSKVDTND